MIKFALTAGILYFLIRLFFIDRQNGLFQTRHDIKASSQDTDFTEYEDIE